MARSHCHAHAPGSARLPGLELLRWIAALCVLLLHASVIFELPGVVSKGYLGVDVFFMLSGFVMAGSLERQPPKSPSPDAQSTARFMLDRWWRMWPMMALGGAIGWPVLAMAMPNGVPFLRVAVPNMLLLPVNFHHEAYPLNVPAWTIIYILLGNLLHRLWLYRLRGQWLALAIAASAVAMAAVAAHTGTFDVGSRPENMALALPRLMLAYLIGMALHRARIDMSPSRLWATMALGLMPVLLAAAWWYGVTSWLFDMAFVVIACPLMFAGAMQLRLDNRWATRWAGFAGAWSFPLYAIHFPLLIRLRNDGFTAARALVIALALAALAALVEQQLRARFAKADGKRPKMPEPTRLT